MNSVINRAITTGNGINYECSKPTRIQKLPSEYFYPGSTTATDHYQHKQNDQRKVIKWRNSEQPVSGNNHRTASLKVDPVEINLAKLRMNNISSQQKLVSRSNSTDVNNLNRRNFEKLNSSCTSVRLIPDNLQIKARPANKSMHIVGSSGNNPKSGHIETSESIIEMHKLFKEKKIYSDPNDNYKRRTIVLVKSGSHNKSMSENNSDFGFHLQSYGLVNTSTQMTEFICFVNNVQEGSPAKQAGLNDGDVLLAIDTIPVNEFNNLQDIMKHVKGKQELRLVIMCENICKKIQLQQRVEKIKAKLTLKKEELDRLNKQQEELLLTTSKSKSPTNLFTSPLSSSASSSMTNSSISESHLFPLSPPFNHSNVLSPELTNQGQTNNIIIKNSTPYDFKSSSILTPDSNNLSTRTNDSAIHDQNHEISSKYQIDAQEIIDTIHRQKSSSSPNGTARIQVDLNLDLTSPIIPTSSSSFSTCSSSSATSSGNSTHNSSVFTFNRTRQLAQRCIQQTSRIVRSASSSSMNLISNLKLNRSGRSRNSSMCSATMNETADLSESCSGSGSQSRKSKKNLNKSYVLTTDELDTTNSVVLENSSLSSDIVPDQPVKKTNLTKNLSLNNKKTRSTSDKSIAKMLAAHQASSGNSHKKPQMINSAAVKSSNSQLNNRKSILSKLNHNTSSTGTNSTDTSISKTRPLSTNSQSKFTILQNKPKNERFKSNAQSCTTASSLDLHSSAKSTDTTNNSTLHKSSVNIFTEPFSPILSNQSSLLNEIIDSGIDVGIGLAASPINNSTSMGNHNNSDGRSVAKVISDGGYSSFINNFSIKDITYSDDVKAIKNNLGSCEKNKNNHSLFHATTTKCVNEDYLITKL